KQAAGLSKGGLAVFEIVYNQIRDNPGQDTVQMSAITSGLEERTYQRGIRELLKKEFLFRSPYDGVFFVNIRFMFNGDRLAFVKAYRVKNSSAQGELPFGEPARLPAPEREIVNPAAVSESVRIPDERKKAEATAAYMRESGAPAENIREFLKSYA